MVLPFNELQFVKLLSTKQGELRRPLTEPQSNDVSVYVSSREHAPKNPTVPALFIAYTSREYQMID